MATSCHAAASLALNSRPDPAVCAQPPRTLQAQSRPQQAVDLAAVRAALGLAHHRADQGAHRLRVAAADALDDVRVLLDHLGDDRLELAAVLHRGEALAFGDLGGVAAAHDQLVEDRAPGG